MKYLVIGHEGYNVPDSYINMGSAALWDRTHIINGVSGYKSQCSEDQLHGFLSENRISVLPHFYRATVHPMDRPYLIRINMHLADYLWLRRSALLKNHPYILSRNHYHREVFILLKNFENVKDFVRSFVSPKIYDLEHRALHGRYDREIRSLLVLGTNQPELLAMKVSNSPNIEISREIYTKFLDSNGFDRFNVVFDRIMKSKVKSDV